MRIGRFCFIFSNWKDGARIVLIIITQGQQQQRRRRRRRRS